MATHLQQDAEAQKWRVSTSESFEEVTSSEGENWQDEASVVCTPVNPVPQRRFSYNRPMTTLEAVCEGSYEVHAHLVLIVVTWMCVCMLVCSA